MFSWTVEDEWKVGKKTLQAAVSQRMISIEKKKRLWKKYQIEVEDQKLWMITGEEEGDG